MSPHDSLMATSAGYREFATERREHSEEVDRMAGCEHRPEEVRESLAAFVGWLTCSRGGDELSGWTADQFRERWDHWNS